MFFGVIIVVVGVVVIARPEPLPKGETKVLPVVAREPGVSCGGGS